MGKKVWVAVTGCLLVVSFGILLFHGSEAYSKSKTVTISFWHHYNAQSPENKTLTTVLIPAFQKKYPNIIVKAVPHEWDQLHKKILISASSKQLPDVARSDIACIAALTDRVVATAGAATMLRRLAGRRRRFRLTNYRWWLRLT